MIAAGGDVRLASYAVVLTNLVLEVVAAPDGAAELEDLHSDALDLLDEVRTSADQADPPMSLEQAAGEHFGATVDELRNRYESSLQRREIEKLAAEARVAHATRLVDGALILPRQSVERLLAHLLAEAAQGLAEAQTARLAWHAGSCEYGRWARAGNLAHAQERRAEADARASGRFSAKRRSAQADAKSYRAQGLQSWEKADAVGLPTIIDDAVASEARFAVAMLKAVHCAAQARTSDGLLDEVTELLSDTEAEVNSRLSTLQSVRSPEAASRLSTELRLLRETLRSHGRGP